LLWWRRTGDVPVRIIAQHLNGSESWPVSTEGLEEIEVTLATQLPLLNEALSARPVVARPGSGCPAALSGRAAHLARHQRRSCTC
jgi:hypothetical protein